MATKKEEIVNNEEVKETAVEETAVSTEANVEET